MKKIKTFFMVVMVLGIALGTAIVLNVKCGKGDLMSLVKEYTMSEKLEGVLETMRKG